LPYEAGRGWGGGGQIQLKQGLLVFLSILLSNYLQYHKVMPTKRQQREKLTEGAPYEKI
jgi:hypothetical protein